MNKFKFLKTFFSPFKPLKIQFYCGEVAIGTPYFYPRRWVRSDKTGYTKPVPKKIGFDFVGLGYKTKWSDTDYRFEWSPVWSFVFFKWQIAIIFTIENLDEYWEAWLYYENNTDKSKSTEERIIQCMKEFSLTNTVYDGKERKKINYYESVLKNKYIKLIK